MREPGINHQFTARSKRSAPLGSCLRACVVGAAALSLGWNAGPSHALTITLNAQPGTSAQAIAGFRAAADRWQANFTDNVTITLNIGFQSLGGSILGQTASAKQSFSFSSVKTSLTNDAGGSDDSLAVASLPTGTAVPRMINFTSNNPNGAASLTPYLQSPGVATLSITKASARAAGLSTTAGTDATITFNSQFSWDFDPTNGVTGGQIDFIGVAVHEIGHAMGFVSTVDALDTSSGNLSHSSSSLRPSTMDLFRYSTLSRDTSGGVIDFSADTRDKYFSLDKGVTSLALLSTGSVHGDGRQASHWKDSLGLGIMDPTISSGSAQNIGEFDRRMLDVIGWNRDYSWRWTGPASANANWNDPQRWDANGVPDARMDVTFSSAGSFGSSLQQNSAARVLNIANGSVVLELAGRTLQVGHVSGPAVTISPGAALTVSGGILRMTLGTASAGLGAANLLVPGGSRITLGSGAMQVGGAMLLGGGSGAATAQFDAGLASIGTEAGTDHNFYVGQSASARVDHAGGAGVSVAGSLLLAPATAVLQSHYEMAGGSLIVGGDLGIAGTGSAATTGIATFAARGSALVNIVGTTHVWGNGSLIIDGAAALSTGALDVAGGRVVLTPGNDKLLQTGGLSITASGVIGLNDNHMLIDYASLGSLPQDLLADIQSGDLTFSTSDPTHRLGYADNAILQRTTFHDVIIPPGDPTQMLLSYTHTGDANLDGRVDVRDLLMLANGWLGAGVWTSGDFDYSGFVDQQDLTLLAQNWQTGTNAPLGQVMEQLGLPSSIPEPGSMGLSLMPMLLLRRRSTHA